MPTEKEMLSATVKATSKLFTRSKAVERIQQQMEADARREEAQEAASTIGETTPEAET